MLLRGTYKFEGVRSLFQMGVRFFVIWVLFNFRLLIQGPAMLYIVNSDRVLCLLPGRVHVGSIGVFPF